MSIVKAKAPNNYHEYIYIIIMKLSSWWILLRLLIASLCMVLFGSKDRRVSADRMLVELKTVNVSEKSKRVIQIH